MHSHARDTRLPARSLVLLPVDRVSVCMCLYPLRACVCVCCVITGRCDLTLTSVWKHVDGRLLSVDQIFRLRVAPISVPWGTMDSCRRHECVSNMLFLLTFHFQYSFLARRADFFYCSTIITTLTSGFWWTIFFRVIKSVLLS